MASASVWNYGLTFSCLVGLGLSIYAYFVELSIEQDDNYEAMCDISEHVSCTKAFKSPYGKGFGIAAKLLGDDSVLNKPNSLLGILFYSLTATLAQSNSVLLTKFSLMTIILSNAASVYFAYILYFILYDFCVICVSTYVVNFVNLLISLAKLRALNKEQSCIKTKKNF